MKAKVFGGALLVIVILSSSVSAAPIEVFYGINPISTFLNGFAVRFIERVCVDVRGTKVNSWTETGNLLGGDADDYANGKMPEQDKDKINMLNSGYKGLDADLNGRSKAIVFFHN